MKIVLVTDKPRGNPVEYFCVANGGRIVGIVNLSNGQYENPNVNIYNIEDLPKIHHELIIVDCDNSAFIIKQIEKYQLKNVYEYRYNINNLFNILHHSNFLCKRIFSVKEDRLISATKFYTCERKITEDLPSLNSTIQQTRITRDVFEAYKHAYSKYPELDKRYSPGENWREFLKGSRPNFYIAIQSSRIDELSDLLKNFFRNELTEGTFGGKKGYDGFCVNDSEFKALRDYFNVWKHCVPDTPIGEIKNPMVGNPYGISVDGSLINVNNFCNHYRSVFLRRLIKNIDKPVIAELGGGFGGLAYYLSKDCPGLTYINFDLPENLIVSSYYLKSNFPEKKTKIYDGLNCEINVEELKGFELVLLPHFCLPLLKDSSVDIFVNTISLSEMDFVNIETYSLEIERVTKKYFYHENMLDNGSGYKYFPTSVFPNLNKFKLLMSAPSRWPAFSLSSTGHCHMEFLYERNER